MSGMHLCLLLLQYYGVIYTLYHNRDYFTKVTKLYTNFTNQIKQELTLMKNRQCQAK